MKKDTRNYGKFHRRFAEGGAVDEPDPNAPERAGSSGYMKDKPWHPENMWWMYKDEYKKADEVSPANKTKDNKIVDPQDFKEWQHYYKPHEQQDT